MKRNTPPSTIYSGFALILLLILIIGSIQAKIPASTTSGGTIISGGSVSGEWNYQNQPYFIEGNISLDKDSTLLIRPGVQVIFNGAYSFDILGSLTAVGEPDSLIYFKGDDSILPVKQWYGLFFNTASGQDAPASNIEFCRFESVINRPGNDKFGAIRVLKHNLGSIKNCEFANCSPGVSLSTNSDISLISNNSFETVTADYAIRLATNNLIETLTISSNIFTNISERAILIENNSNKLEQVVIVDNIFDNSNLTSNAISSIEIKNSHGLANIHIENNQLNAIRNNLSAIYINANNNLDQVLLKNNTITDCGSNISLAGALHLSKANQVFSENNIIESNEGIKGGALYVESSAFISKEDHFIENLNNSTLSAYPYGRGGAIHLVLEGENAGVHINGSNFTENQSYRDGAALYINAQSENITSFDSLLITNSSFLANSTNPFGSGSILKLALNVNLGVFGSHNNEFIDNLSFTGGAIDIVSQTSPPHAGHIAKFESVNNQISFHNSVNDQNNYIQFVGTNLPDELIFSNETISNVNSRRDSRLIDFIANAGNPAHLSFINVSNSSFHTANKGIFGFETNGIVQCLISGSDFSNIHAPQSAAISISAGQVNSFAVLNSSFTNLSDNQGEGVNNGGAIHLYSASHIDSLHVENNQFSDIHSLGSGGVLYSRANGHLGQVNIEGSVFENFYSSAQGGAFYIHAEGNAALNSGIIVKQTEAANPSLNETEGKGGFIYFNSKATIENLLLEDVNFSGIRSKSDGGLFFIEAQHIDLITLGGTQNTFSNISSQGSGGIVYAKTNGIVGSIDITHSNFQNFFAGLHGGAFCIFSEGTPSFEHELNISQSTFTNSAGIVTESKGGFMYFSSKSTINGLHFENITASGLSSKGHGGMFCLETANINSLIMNSSQFANTSSLGSGGLVYAKASGVIGSIEIENSSISNFQAGGHGGAFYLLSESNPSFEHHLTFSETVASNSSSLIIEGKGGFMYFDTKANLAELWLQDVSFAGVRSKDDGGLFYLEAGHINQITLDGNQNQFNNISSLGSGGVFYAKASGSSGSLSIQNTAFENFHAGLRGGAFYLLSESNTGLEHQIHIGNSNLTNATGIVTQGRGGFMFFQTPATISGLWLEDVACSGISANSDGGLFYLEANNIQQLTLNGSLNTFNNISSLGSGGIFYSRSTGVIGSIEIENSRFTNFQAGQHGGAFYLLSEGNPAFEHHFTLRESLVSNNPGLITGGKGGFMYFDTKANMAHLWLQDLSSTGVRSNDDGGMIYLEAAGIQQITLDGNQNQFNNISSQGSGGILYAKTSGASGSLQILNTNFENFYAGSDGGAFYLLSESNPGFNHLISIEKSTMTNSPGLITQGKGGFMYFNTPANIQSLGLEDISGSGIRANHDGGIFYMEANNIHQITLTGSLNTFNNVASNGSGGLLYGHAKGFIGSINVENTNFTNLRAAQHGGAFYLLSEGTQAPMDELILQNINITNNPATITGGNGGFLFCHANAALGSILFQGSKVNGMHIGSSGGVLYLNTIGTGILTISDNEFSNIANQNSAGSDRNGGVLFVNSNNSNINSLSVSNNNFNHINGFADGGAIYVLGKGLTAGSLSNNHFTEIYADRNGGMVHINNTEVSGSISFESNEFSNSGTNEKIPVNGGALYLLNTDNITLAENSFAHIHSSETGGAIYMENVNHANLNNSSFRSLSSGNGGAMYFKGDRNTSTLFLGNIDLLHNKADLTGGALFIESADSVIIGSTQQPNRFITNDALEHGGAAYLSNVNYFETTSATFNGNTTQKEGGAFYVNSISQIHFNQNLFNGNTAFEHGGAISLKDVVEGEIAHSIFQHNQCTGNSTTVPNRGGAIHRDFSTIYNAGFIELSDNVFYKNTAVRGGAVFTFDPLVIKRNLFRENEVMGSLDLQKGAAIRFENVAAKESVVYNSVFDNNRTVLANDGTLYFSMQTGVTGIREYSVYNSTFLNTGANKGIFFSRISGSDTLKVINSIFQNSAKKNEELMITSAGNPYFNQIVSASYSNLFGVENLDNNNFNIWVGFNSGCYTFDTVNGQHLSIINKGHPDLMYFDYNIPPAFEDETNDPGMTGGPHNPEIGSFLLCEYSDTLSLGLVVNQVCNDYQLVCNSPLSWSKYYWFLPDDRIIETPTNTLTVEIFLEPGMQTFRVMAENSVGTSAFGYRTINVSLLEINSFSLDGLTPTSPGFFEDIVYSIPIEYDAVISLANFKQDQEFDWTLDYEATGLTIEISDPNISNDNINFTVRVSEIAADVAMRNFTLNFFIEQCIEANASLHLDMTAFPVIPEVDFIHPVNELQIACEDSLVIVIRPYVLFFDGEVIGADNVTSIISLKDTELEETIEYAVGDIILNAPESIRITIWPDTNMTCNKLNIPMELLVHGDMIKTPDYKISIENDPSILFYYIEPTGVPYLELVQKIYPNPVQDILSVELKESGNYTLSIYNSQGKKVGSYELRNQNRMTINVEDLSDGLYLLEILSHEHQYVHTTRFIKVSK